jgi:hypothetical protein
MVRIKSIFRRINCIIIWFFGEALKLELVGVDGFLHRAERIFFKIVSLDIYNIVNAKYIV